MAVIRIGVDNVPEPDVVELFEHKFTIKRVTRSVQKQLEATDKKLRGLGDDADGDTLVQTIAEGLDVLLAPNGQKTAAKTVLLKHWRADELTLDQIGQLYEGVQESAARRPPTSSPAT
jgi:hypothetical protein